MSNAKLAALAVLIPLALATPLMAQDRGGPDGPRMVFETVDANGDGSITLEELQAVGPGRFAEADTDGDGVLTRDELIAAGQARVAAGVDRMIARADADADGQLTLEELAELRDGRRGPNPSRILGRMDADGDGAISRAEFDDAAARLMRRHGPWRDRG